LVRWPRRLLRRSNRKLTRTGLLEYHYEKFLYGDTSLFQLPECPELHILATNLSEGCLCSFNRNGLWMVRRQPGHNFRVDRIHVGLATVPMAVTASSAFPGFFPPAELTGTVVGANVGDFGRQAFTDGGVFDNLGVRMFRFLELSGRGEQNGLAGVLVSDVGKPIEVQSNRRTGGLIRTALRASDILMDRVWQLENETFEDTSGFVFARITAVVEPKDDPTALHPEIQRQTANIRTDMDRFSPLEISSLVRHGYCVGRQACRARPEVFGADLPDNAPWNPIPESQRAAPAGLIASHLHDSHREAAAATVEARKLQASALRRIWSTLSGAPCWTTVTGPHTSMCPLSFPS
jgi:predicted acylesterase/phospholipase RssA